ncbi:MAG: NAD(P)/FAD-dependent oxidoreductase [Anaerolineae bacterium]|nr:NAD(P)/FAD-dependent oxidoreductase [Anaerolineae bacterium]
MKAAIVGCGATGLAAAWELASAGHEVTIYEAGKEVGGLAAGFKDPAWDWALEKFYHHWFATDTDILSLLEAVGTRGKVQFHQPVTSIWRAEGNVPIDKPVLPVALLARVVNVLGIPGLSLWDKLRFGAAGFLLTKYKNGVELEKYTAEAWLRRWVGERAYNLVWRPLLIGKFGEWYDRVNMAWMWARLYKRTAALGTYAGGFQAALEDIAEAVCAKGATIHLETPIHRLTPVAGGVNVETRPALSRRFDRVLSTVGPGLMLRLAPELSGEYAAQMRALKSLGAVALVLALDRQLMTDGTYWLNLPAQSPDRRQNPFPFLALVEHTNYVAAEHFGGEHIVYLGDYVPQEHEYFRMSEAELADLFLPALAKVNPDFTPAWIRRRWLFRAPYAQPVPLVNHSQHIPLVKTPIAGLFWASMSQVYPWDRGTNYAVEIGRRAAWAMMTVV